MRLAVLLLALALASCGSAPGIGRVSDPEASPNTTAGSPTPRVTTPATLDCPNVSWAKHYRSLAQIGYDAQLVVRATAVSQDVVQVKAFAAGALVSLRDAQRTTFQVTSVLRTNGPAAESIRVLEDVCPNLEVRPGEEWILFLYRWDPTYGPDGADVHFTSTGGPQSQFRIKSGAITGPFFTFAEVVHSYERAPIAELLRDIAALPAP